MCTTIRVPGRLRPPQYRCPGWPACCSFPCPRRLPLRLRHRPVRRWRPHARGGRCLPPSCGPGRAECLHRSAAVDVTVLDTAHFDFMQHGLNHVAAHAAREGVTPRGERYKPPKPSPDHLPGIALPRSHGTGRLCLRQPTLFGRNRSKRHVPAGESRSTGIASWDGIPRGLWNTRSRL